MTIEEQIRNSVNEGLLALYEVKINDDVKLQATTPPHEGDLTIVVFAFTRFSKKSPEVTGTEIGEYLVKHSGIVSGFNVIKGFLNLSISSSVWMKTFLHTYDAIRVGRVPVWIADSPRTVMVEYSSPNTNKPLHLGHIRNILLGYAVSEILISAGHKVVKANLINDRGIHICKSMIAWKLFGNGETPQSSGMKGDHLVGKYYVKFDQQYKDEVGKLIAGGLDEKEAKNTAPIMLEAQSMLRKWEAGDAETIALWKMMNGWVYEGFDISYKRLGVDFDQYYYESETYLLGKNLVKEGLKADTLYQKEDGSVWADLGEEGFEDKVLLRSDGTSVYITQDLGTADLKFQQYDLDKSIYIVGNEQDHHFKVLKAILKKLGKTWYDRIFHLSYGMVNLPSGKMKSREGTVVDADELMDEMFTTAKETTTEAGKISEFSETEANELFTKLGMSALKYYILKVDPQKTMLFNPSESIDFNGNTGTFIQYTYARISSVLRKAGTTDALQLFRTVNVNSEKTIEEKEKALIKMLYDYKRATCDAATNLSPALIAAYAYDLAKSFNQFYHECPIADVADIPRSVFRLQLAESAAAQIKHALALLGIEVPERM